MSNKRWEFTGETKIHFGIALPRLWYRNWMHRTLVRNQFRGWLRRNKWRGKRRFDVVMVLPPSGCVGRHPIDHIVDVKM